MEITPELKKKLEAAKTAEEKKKLLAEAGLELTDEEIEKVAGGIVVSDWRNGKLFEKVACGIVVEDWENGGLFE